jgi:hypothetical protein
MPIAASSFDLTVNASVSPLVLGANPLNISHPTGSHGTKEGDGWGLPGPPLTFGMSASLRRGFRNGVPRGRRDGGGVGML